MDAALWGLVGVIIGAVLSSALGAWLAHGKWVREARLGAYADYYAVMTQLVLSPPRTQESQDALRERQFVAHARAMVLASDTTIDRSGDLLDAVSAAAKTDPESPERAAFTSARAAFLTQAKADTMRWWTLGR